MGGYHIGQRMIIHKDPFAYVSHPSICIRADGAWVAAFNHSCRRSERLHPPSDPLFRTLISISRDQGASWDAPFFAPDFSWSGTECPGVAALQSGEIVLTQFRFGWYSLAEARKRWEAGELISLCLPERGWTEDLTAADWNHSVHTWARGYHGVYSHISQDGGQSFVHTANIATAPYRCGYSRTGVVELTDGRVVYALSEHHPPHNRYTYLVASADGCRSWSEPIPIVDDEPKRRFTEPDIAETLPGELCCILRSRKDDGYLYSCRSVDGGLHWSEPIQTPLYGRPGQLLVLADGRLLCTYGRRDTPYGIRACLSEDGGRSWNAEEICIRRDLPNADLGYPTTIEYAPGRLFCCYYGQETDGVTCVQGSFVDLM